MQKKWKHTLAGVAMMFALGAGTTGAATFNVPCPGGVGDVAALVQAIDDANNTAGADTITLESGCVFTLTAVNNSYYLGPTGLPLITSEIVIDGNGSTITRDSTAPDFRIFAIEIGGNLTLRGTTVSGGKISDNARGQGGGGVFSIGTLSITDSTITGNSTSSSDSPGGGVFSGDTLTISNSTITGNSTLSDYSGGGGVSGSGTVTIDKSTISGNSTSGSQSDGGGVSGFILALTITESTISGNSTSGSDSDGGGVASGGSLLSIANSTITGNSTSGDFSGGGGVYNSDAMSITDSTISGNSTSGNFCGGGGVYSIDDTLTLTRTLISGNTAFGVGDEVYSQPSVVTPNAYNLFGHSGISTADALFGVTPGATDITATYDGTMPTALSFILAPLANNGGPTQTHALVEGSPAIDTVGATCSAADQRVVFRPQGIACDIGAFELIFVPDTPAGSNVVTQPQDTTTGTTPVTVTFSNVTQAGDTDLTTDTTGPTTPSGFQLGDPSIYYDITTTAMFSGPVEVCINYAEGTFVDETMAQLFHFEGVQWLDVTTSLDTTNNIICGSVTSLSPFAIFEAATPTPMTCNGLAPTNGCTVNGVANQPCVGTEGNDVIRGTGGTDVIVGLGGNDRISGAVGSDTICGDEGNDRLSGGGSADLLIGGEGTDRADGQGGTDDCDAETVLNCETVLP